MVVLIRLNARLFFERSVIDLVVMLCRSDTTRGSDSGSGCTMHEL